MCSKQASFSPLSLPQSYTTIVMYIGRGRGRGMKEGRKIPRKKYIYIYTQEREGVEE
jgi:hypothetical protein